MEDPSYVEYFAAALSTAPSSHPKMQLKTEGHEPEDNKYEEYATNSQHRGKQDLQSYSKINIRSGSQKSEPEVEEARSKVNALTAKLNLVLE